MRRLVFLLALVFSAGFASLVSASINQTVFVVNDSLFVTGGVDSSTAVSVDLYSGSSLVKSTSSTVTGTFNMSLSLNVSEGDYEARVSDGTKTIYFPIKLLGERLNFMTFLIPGMNQFIYQSTPTQITTGGEGGGNYTDLLTLSRSGTLWMGSDPNHTYVLVDTRNSGEYDTLYKDDDNRFLLYNDSEDSTGYVEKSRRLWDVFDSYVIPFMDSSGFFLARATGSPTYAPGSTVHMIVITTNETDDRVSRTVNVSLRDPDGGIPVYRTGTTNLEGYLYLNFTAPGAGQYLVLVNGKPTESILVKTIDLFVQVTDEAGNPTRSFRPTGVTKFVLSGKSSSGPVALSSPAMKVIYPNGTVKTITLKADGMTYRGELSLKGLKPGEYGVEAIASSGGETQKAKASFSIMTAKPEAMAINLDYIDQYLTVNNFGLGKNITILVTLYNLSKPMMMGEPCAGGSCIPLDEGPGGERCSDRISLEYVLDEYGQKVSFPEVSIVNVSEAAPPGEEPPEGVKNQCMVIIQTANQSGNFKAFIRMEHPEFTGEQAVPFSLKALYAIGNPVDSEGNNFGFFKPGGTVRLQLKVKNLGTGNWVKPDEILDPKLVEVRQLWPGYKDMFEEPGYNKSVANESISDGILMFTAPNSEGFYEIKFRFKANLSDNLVDGEGSASISLKKYFIDGFATDFYTPGSNVTLSVSVVDADSAGWGSSSCTGCIGLTANVSKLRNEQTGKVYGTGEFSYTSTAITSSSSGLSITIQTGNLDPGWYSVEYTLYDPENPSATYIGWGGFELRNFWVKVIPLRLEGGNYTPNYEGQYSNFTNITFGIIVGGPMGGEQPDSVSISSFGLDVFGYTVDTPSVITNQGTGSVCMEEGCLPMYLVTVWADAPQDGRYRVSFKATKGVNSDIGTAWIEKSSFGATILFYPEDRKSRWPVPYASDETFLITFEGYNDTGKHALKNVTVDELFSEKKGMPVKFKYGDNYSVSCGGWQCNVSFNLTGFEGKYFIDFQVEDQDGKTKSSSLEIVIRDKILAIPQLVEAFSNGELNLERSFGWLYNSEDRCNNRIVLSPDQCDVAGWEDTLCLSGMNFELAENKIAGTTYYGGMFLVTEPGWDFWNWKMAGATDPKNVYIVSNGTNFWVNSNESFKGLPRLKEGDIFEINGTNWTVAKLENGEIVVRAPDGICGNYESCDEWGCNSLPLKVVPPQGYENFSKYYFGEGNLFWVDMGMNMKSCADSEFPFAAFHNGTHLWVREPALIDGIMKANFSSVAPAAEGQTIQLNGSSWEIVFLDSNEIKFRAVDRLFSGHHINASKARGKKVKIGEIQESMTNDKSGFETGVDLDGDGFTNGSITFVIFEGTTPGVFDTFGYGVTSCNITDYIDVNSPRTQRQVGDGDNLTLLSITSLGDRVLLYADKPGEMPWLGEFSSTGTFKVPVIVTAPNGTFVKANVSADKFRKTSESGDIFISLTPAPNTTIDGVGELTINASELVAQGGTGNYFIGLIANASGSLIKMEDWMWPNVFIRTFFSKTDTGRGTYLTGFQKFKSYRSGWPMHLEADNETVIRVTEFNYEDPSSCSFTPPPDRNVSGSNHTYRLLEDYWMYENTGNKSKAWIKKGNCDFSGETAISEGDTYNFSFGDGALALKLLNATINQTRIGVAGISFPATERMEGQWTLVGINASGTVIDLLIVNETMEVCKAFNLKSCGHAAYVSFDGNFSGSSKYSVGENFTPGLYIQYVSPWGEIVMVGEGSGGFITDRGEDNANQSYLLYDENATGIDLNGDGLYTNVSVLLFDDRKNGEAKQTSIMIDDDNELIPRLSIYNSSGTFNYDYGSEEREEEEGSLPEGGWYGHMFNVLWDIPEATEDSVIMFMHGTTPGNKIVTLLARIYDFYGNPVAGANASIAKIRRFGLVPKLLVEGSDYNVTPLINTTTQQGYAMFDLDGNWEEGEYWIKLNVTKGGQSDLIDGWMHIGWW